MKQILILTTLLWSNLAVAQNFLDKLYDPNCSTQDSLRTVTSEFYPVELKLPIGREGDFEGELPMLRIKKKISSKSIVIRLGSAYDASGIFEWAQENFDPNTFEIDTIKATRVLIEKPIDQRTYMLSFVQYPDSNDPWVWRLEIIGAIGYEDEIICDVTFLLEQLIRNN